MVPWGGKKRKKEPDGLRGTAVRHRGVSPFGPPRERRLGGALQDAGAFVFVRSSAGLPAKVNRPPRGDGGSQGRGGISIRE